MSRNVGNIDRILRVILGIVLVGLGLYVSTTPLGAVGLIVLIGAGLLMLITAAINFCPMYTVLNFRTFNGENE